MKIVLFVFAISFLIFSTDCYPAKNDDVELIEVVPLERQRNGTRGTYDDDDDIPVGYFPVAFAPFNIDFSSIFTGFDEWIANMRNRLHSLIGDAEIDGDKGNTTSTVKVIDNHKVVINDTVYSKDTAYGTQFVKVRTVHVKPLGENDTETVSNTNNNTDKNKNTTPKRDTELDDDDENDESNQVLNERQLNNDAEIVNSEMESSSSSIEAVSANLDDDLSDVEIFDLESQPMILQDIQNTPNMFTHRQPRPTFYNNPHFNNNPHFSNSHHFQNRPAPQSNYPPFLFPATPNFNRPFYPPPPVQEFPEASFDTNNDFSSPDSASEVHDLTNDIRVNQVLAEQGRPFHPDAEFISVPNQPRPRPFESYPQQYPPYYFTAFRDIKK